MFSCKGACLAMPDPKAIPHQGGRTPVDPSTGRHVPPGTYGPWKRCRMCAVLLVWQGIFCPCCGIRLSDRPRASRHRRSARITAARRIKRAAMEGGGGIKA